METDIKQPQQTEIDPDRQQKAREYARIRRQLSLVGIGIAAIAILFIFWSGLDVALRDWLQPLSWQPLPGWYPLQVLLYFLFGTVPIGSQKVLESLLNMILLITEIQSVNRIRMQE